MASFYLPNSNKALAEAIASASQGRVIDRVLSGSVEVYGDRLLVTHEMILDHLKASGLGQEPSNALAELEHTTWEMLKRNATGTLIETEGYLIVEGVTEMGQEPKRGGCLAVAVTASVAAVAVLVSIRATKRVAEG